MRLLEFHQNSRRNAQRFCQHADIYERDISLSALNATHVTASQATFEGQLFLRQPLGFSHCCQLSAEFFLDVQNSTQKEKMLCVGLLSGHAL